MLLSTGIVNLTRRASTLLAKKQVITVKINKNFFIIIQNIKN
ncbi:hypothetical protein M141_1852 [Bacteroides fragilis str. S38L5]|uniref:Uncharacterized protein n=1 Tax=Bacteroides fragilis str. 2-F-2 \|nr:hypothetical protein M145_1807 [Bacteroides fragilis str. 34-F-2 \